MVLDQNDLNSPKLFEPIEGQGIKLLIRNEGKLGQVQCIQGVRTLNVFFFTDVINSYPNMLESIDGDFQGGRSTAIVCI